MLPLQRPYVTPGYSYTGWSPPAQSNEASNGYEKIFYTKYMYVIIESGDACTAVKVITLLLMVTVLQCTCICVHASQVLSRAIQQCQANPQES